MKKYILAALLAAFVMIGPSVGSANAQGYFYRGGPTFIDRLFGNGGYGGYGGYGNYGGYGMGYGGYNPYAYNTSFYRGGYVNPFGGGYNRYNNYGWHHHHWHHHW